MHEIVKDYYGNQLQSSDDLRTSACCDVDAVPAWLKKLLARVHPEVLARYYGCGLVCPELLEGARILDLGCGSGRDVYALAQLVGPHGRVVGVDMTEAQLEVARNHREHHRDAFGHGESNVDFTSATSSACTNFLICRRRVLMSSSPTGVVNLSPDKEAVLRGVFSLLKPGGEFYFSDVYADRRVP